MRHSLTTLEVFVATAEERNLTRAAERCHLAPSAVSKRISELERLTAAGQSMLHHARQVLRSMQKMDDELNEYAHGVKGHVRVQAVISALSQYLPADFARFLHRYPLIKLDIEEHIGDAIIAALIDGRTDVGVFIAQSPPPGLETFEYRSDELVLAVPAAHPLAACTSTSFADALDFEFIGPHAGSSLNALMHRSAVVLGRRVRQRTHVSSFDCMARMVAEGLGIAILPRALLQSYMAFLDLRGIDLQEAWARRTMLVGVRDPDALSFAARALVEQLRPSS